MAVNRRSGGRPGGVDMAEDREKSGRGKEWLNLKGSLGTEPPPTEEKDGLRTTGPALQPQS